MYADLYDQGTFNIKLAKLTNLQTACYWNELTQIMHEVIRKKKFEADTGFFTLNRTYVEQRTTLTTEEQLACEAALKKLCIYEVKEDNPDMVRVDLAKMTQLISESTEQEFKRMSKIAKVTAKDKAKAKKEGIISAMQKYIQEDDAELKQAYNNWVESVYEGKRFLTHAVIDQFLNEIRMFSPDKSVQLELLKSAIANGYTEATWIISDYQRNHRTKSAYNSAAAPTATIIGKPQRVATSADDLVDEAF